MGLYTALDEKLEGFLPGAVAPTKRARAARDLALLATSFVPLAGVVGKGAKFFNRVKQNTPILWTKDFYKLFKTPALQKKFKNKTILQQMAGASTKTAKDIFSPRAHYYNKVTGFSDEGFRTLSARGKEIEEFSKIGVENLDRAGKMQLSESVKDFYATTMKEYASMKLAGQKISPQLNKLMKTLRVPVSQTKYIKQGEIFNEVLDVQKIASKKGLHLFQMRPGKLQNMTTDAFQDDMGGIISSIVKNSTTKEQAIAAIQNKKSWEKIARATLQGRKGLNSKGVMEKMSPQNIDEWVNAFHPSKVKTLKDGKIMINFTPQRASNFFTAKVGGHAIYDVKKDTLQVFTSDLFDIAAPGSWKNSLYNLGFSGRKFLSITQPRTYKLKKLPWQRNLISNRRLTPKLKKATKSINERLKSMGINRELTSDEVAAISIKYAKRKNPDDLSGVGTVLDMITKKNNNIVANVIEDAMQAGSLDDLAIATAKTVTNPLLRTSDELINATVGKKLPVHRIAPDSSPFLQGVKGRTHSSTAIEMDNINRWVSELEAKGVPKKELLKFFAHRGKDLSGPGLLGLAATDWYANE